jgi:hypothetical protein
MRAKKLSGNYPKIQITGRQFIRTCSLWDGYSSHQVKYPQDIHKATNTTIFIGILPNGKETWVTIHGDLDKLHAKPTVGDMILQSGIPKNVFWKIFHEKVK